MAITTLDQALAGMRPMQFIHKVATPNGGHAAGSGILLDMAFNTGSPGDVNFPTGTGLTGAAPLMTDEGYFKRDNPPPGQNAYLARFGGFTGAAGMLLLVDRLWHNSWSDATTTALQTIQNGTQNFLPPRDEDGGTTGKGVMLALESHSVVGAPGTGGGSIIFEVGYTNDTGTTGTFTSLWGGGEPAFQMEMASGFNITAGYRSVNSMKRSQSQTSGTMGAVLFRIIAALNLKANVPASIDILTGGMPRIYDGSCLHLMWVPTELGVSSYYSGCFQETWG